MFQILKRCSAPTNQGVISLLEEMAYTGSTIPVQQATTLSDPWCRWEYAKTRTRTPFAYQIMLSHSLSQRVPGTGCIGGTGQLNHWIRTSVPENQIRYAVIRLGIKENRYIRR